MYNIFVIARRQLLNKIRNYFYSVEKKLKNVRYFTSLSIIKNFKKLLQDGQDCWIRHEQVFCDGNYGASTIILPCCILYRLLNKEEESQIRIFLDFFINISILFNIS